MGKPVPYFFMKSLKRVKPLSEIILPFQITFPVTIEGGVNNEIFCFPANRQVILTYSQYECITNSDFVRYLH